MQAQWERYPVVIYWRLNCIAAFNSIVSMMQKDAKYSSDLTSDAVRPTKQNPNICR